MHSLCSIWDVQVEATHAYYGEDEDELSFEAGDIIYVIPFENEDEQVRNVSWVHSFRGGLFYIYQQCTKEGVPSMP